MATRCSREAHPRIVRVATAALLVAAGLAALALLAGCATPPDSGITGTVTIGPVQPVAQPGVPDTKAYSAELKFTPKEGLHLKRPITVTSGQDGAFEVDLEAGDWVIESAGTQGSPPTLAPMEVVVQPHEYTSVELQYDSGIR